jgi:hypothetical protein
MPFTTSFVIQGWPRTSWRDWPQCSPATSDGAPQTGQQ